ncbi:GNAT family N-acetyltransferase [Photobacterium galatheae]|uniref:Ribosomal protein acetyltransferase n=1 Tax=Photobacterium galatheae TaxID=1654360 RepID=A0A066RWS7_9GAMM|nr:GNAT family N-acetyltransferase [Photobacterium galatheae]KDM93556.1 ribosomal protein acetyltransferase [Photobacterium galatheae]MCM0151380.1 GNAT family N-acetyltransferase [Photobacterium galatheae]
MESKRIQLVPPSLKYTESMLVAIHESKSDLSQFLPWVSESFTENKLRSNIKEAIENFTLFTGEFWFNLIEKETGLFIGAVGFIVRDKSVPYFEIGYWLQTSKTDKGYITEAVKLIEEYAFKEKHAQRLEIKMAKSNLKSQAVAKRCGFQLEACLTNARRLPSGELDSTVVYAKVCS